MTTGLLVAAAALPVPLVTSTATAAEQRSTPFAHPPQLVRRHTLPDAYAADATLAGSRAGEGRRHPGRPESREYPPELPDADMDVSDLPGLRDFLAEIPHESPRYPDEPSEYFPWLDRYHDPDPDPDSSPPPDSDATPAPDPEAEPPESPSDEAPGPAGTAPAAPSSPAPRSDVAGRRDQRPYKPLRPPAKPHKQDRTPPDDADADPSAAPYAMDTPTAPVERVLPMGAGLALTGLGLAFLGLRLRRR